MSETPIRRSIPAANGNNPGILTVDANGRVLSCLSSTAKFSVRLDSGEIFELSSGRYVGSPDTSEFGRITLYNYTATILDIECIAGDRAYKPDGSISSVNAAVTVSGQNKATYTKGTAAAISGGSDVFAGVDGANARKSFSVRNKEAAGSGNNISVLGANAAEIYDLPPQESFIVESGGLITLAGGAFNYCVCEVFYSP